MCLWYKDEWQIWKVSAEKGDSVFLRDNTVIYFCSKWCRVVLNTVQSDANGANTTSALECASFVLVQRSLCGIVYGCFLVQQAEVSLLALEIKAVVSGLNHFKTKENVAFCLRPLSSGSPLVSKTIFMFYLKCNVLSVERCWMLRK